MPTAQVGPSEAGAPPRAATCCHRSTWITAVSNFGVQYNYEAISWSFLWLDLVHGDVVWAKTLASNMIFVGTLLGSTCTLLSNLMPRDSSAQLADGLLRRKNLQ